MSNATPSVISKISKGSSAAGALKYDLTKDFSKLLDTNCASSDWNGIAAEMDAVSASNTRCKTNTLHVSLSSTQTLTDDQWKDAGRIYRREMGLGGHQHALSRHADTKHDHVHITINRISPDGKAWNDSNDRRRSHAACRVIEKELGLQVSLEIDGGGRFEQTKKDLSEATAASKGKGLELFKSEMSKRGYNVIENRQATGRLAGLSIQSRQDGKTWKASELRKGGARDIMTQLDRPTSSIKHRNHHSGQVMAGAMGKTAGRQVGKALSAIGGPLGGGIAGKIITAMAKTPKKTREQER